MSDGTAMTNAEARSVGVCQHGSLRRSCETCELADQLEIAEGHLAALRAPTGIAAAPRGHRESDGPMSLWACANGHLQGYTESMVCAVCGQGLAFATVGWESARVDNRHAPYEQQYDDRRLTDTPCPACGRVIQHGPCKDPTRCRYRLLGQSEPKGAWATTNTRGPDEPL